MSGAKPVELPSVDWRRLTKLERKISTSDGDSIMERWHFGREILKSKLGKKKLPDGLLADLVAAAGTKTTAKGEEKPKISEREIRNRVQLAEIYPTEAHVRQIIAELELWSAIVGKNFPEVVVDVPLFDLEAEEIGPPDAWQQLDLLPGFRPTVKIGGREKPSAQLTMPEALAYRERSRQTHQSYGKWLAQIEMTVDIALEAWDGNPETTCLDAYNRAMASP